jgi:amino acid permease
MIGSSIIIYPVLFVKDGIIGSMLIMSVIGIALYLTCRLLLIHNRPDEADFNQQIKRILGLKWARFNNYVNFILLYFVCIAYFMLITQNFFAITSTIILAINSNYIVPE